MNRIIVLSSLLLALSLSINYVLDREADSQLDEAPRNDPDLYMLNASIQQFNEAGNFFSVLSLELKQFFFSLTKLSIRY